MDFFVLSSRRAPSYWIAVKEFEFVTIMGTLVITGVSSI